MKIARILIAPFLCWIFSHPNLFAQPAFSKKQPVFIEGIELTAKTTSTKTTDQSDNSNASIHEYGQHNRENSNKEEHYSPLQFKYAQLLDMELEKIVNLKLYDLIDGWMHTKYRYGGSSKSGIDCSGFTGMIFQHLFDISLPRMATEQYKACEKISKDQLKEGDLVFFSNKKFVSHVGMYLGNNFFVHSSTKEGVTISSLHEDYYSRKFYGCGRINKTVSNQQF